MERPDAALCRKVSRAEEGMTTPGSTEELPDRAAGRSRGLLGVSTARIATRATSGTMLNRLAKRLPNLVGGSRRPGSLQQDLHEGRRRLLRREPRRPQPTLRRARARHGGHLQRHRRCTAACARYCGTFFVFSDYMKHAMRMSCHHEACPSPMCSRTIPSASARTALPIEPVEQLAGLRAMPGLTGDSAPPTARKPPPAG